MHPIALVATVFSLSLTAAQDKAAPTAPASQPAIAETAKSPLEFVMKDIDGDDVPLSRYRGQVLLIVNVASQCGLTPQYEQLQQVYDKYKERGLRIAAFPANNFGAQEPGTNREIKEFCQSKYQVGFDLFAKISVKGDDTAELYKYLTTKTGDQAGEIKWNFTKFLVNRSGMVVARFEPRIRPDAPEMTKAIEQALGEPAAAPPKSAAPMVGGATGPGSPPARSPG
jgi:glutathione peroxidase